MFSKRADGRAIKSLAPFYKIIPYIMKERSDAQVFFEDEICIDNLEEYLRRKREEGTRLSYMHVVIAAMTRVAMERPSLNRFVMNRKIYSRNDMVVSLALKKNMNDESIETTVKFHIKPTDTVFDIAKQIDGILEDNKKVTTSNKTDKLAEKIMKLPRCIIKFAVETIMFLDRHNMLPGAIIEASPFHNSLFITNTGSLGIDSIYHHIYNFGTTSIFLAMGNKREKIIDVDTGETSKFISFKFVNDERICDGLYYARSFAAFRRYLNNPELLEVSSQNIKEDIK